MFFHVFAVALGNSYCKMEGQQNARFLSGNRALHQSR